MAAGSANEYPNPQLAPLQSLLSDAAHFLPRFDLNSLRTSTQITSPPRPEQFRRPGVALTREARARKSADEQVAFRSSLQAWESRRAAAEHADRRRGELIDTAIRAQSSNDPTGIETAAALILTESRLPAGLHNSAGIDFDEGHQQIVVVRRVMDFESCVPLYRGHRYLKNGERRDARLSDRDRKNLYERILCSFALRSAAEVLRVTPAAVGRVVVNVVATATDPATGRLADATLVSLGASRDSLAAIDLTVADPSACVRALGGRISPKPTEHKPVSALAIPRPGHNRGADLGELEQRPNLLEMDPFDFEELLTRLFNAMGFEATTTQRSGDGGIDVVAINPDPIHGGRTVISAKRYAGTVGPAYVRELFGTVTGQGANKGLLITTGSFGPSAVDFADDKPIELISGRQLLGYLDQHLGMKARIEPPAVAPSASQTTAPAQPRPAAAEAVSSLPPPMPPPPRPPVAAVSTRPTTGLGRASSVPLQRGENTSLPGERVLIETGHSAPIGSADLSAFLLDSRGRCASDASFVFYNQPSAPGVVLADSPRFGPGRAVRIDVSQLPSSIETVQVVLSVDAPHDVRSTAGSGLLITCGAAAWSVAIAPEPGVTGVVLAEVYRRGGAWKIRHVAQGYTDGLAGIVRAVGLEPT